MIKRIIRRFSDKFFSSWAVLIIDVVISTFATLFTIVLLWRIIHKSISLLSLLDISIISALASLLAFYSFKTFRIVIRHTSLRTLWQFVMATLSKVLIMLAYIIIRSENHTITDTLKQWDIFAVVDFSFTIVAIILVRMLLIMIYDYIKNKFVGNDIKNIFVYGTDNKSVSMITRLNDSNNYKIVGFIVKGKDASKYHISGFPVLACSNKNDFEKLTDKYGIGAVLFKSNDDLRAEKEGIVQYALDSSIKVLVAPSIDEVVDGVVTNSIREIKIEDLLGREEIEISMDAIIDNFRDKCIMVTGAAGSIGSELCRQLASFGVKKLILFDNAETPMHNIRIELEARFPKLDFVPVIGDVRSRKRLDSAFKSHSPQVVFHAAAYKHVPLMEENPCEAAATNVIGSRIIADKCVEYDVEKMVMISTDKAVNPTNVMGCTKRLAEIYVQSLGLAIERGEIQAKTKFVTTRFGNVLGSNGSVIPRFREQIANGGPITVTHPEIVRFFMTIPEACRLVMEAATLATSTQIFVFDMGEPVKIVDLAKRMIALSGLQEGRDIKIEFTGLRPGEKLYEEMLASAENTIPTNHSRIMVAKVREYNYSDITTDFEELKELASEGNINGVVKKMKAIVPEFKSKNSVFEKFD